MLFLAFLCALGGDANWAAFFILLHWLSDDSK